MEVETKNSKWDEKSGELPHTIVKRRKKAGECVAGKRRRMHRRRGKVHGIQIWMFLLAAGIFCLRYAQGSLQDSIQHSIQYSTGVFGSALSILYPVSSAKSLEQEEQKEGKERQAEESWIARILPIVRYSLYAETEKTPQRTDSFDPSYAHYQEMIQLYEEISMKNGLGEETEETLAETAGEDIPHVSYADSTEGAGPSGNGEEQSSSSMKEPAGGESAGSSVSLKNVSANSRISLPYAMEQLADYDFLMQKIYNVHSSTTAQREVMNARTFLEKDFSITKQEGEPQILIYHSHSQELYLEEGAGEDGASVVAAGSILTKNLEEKGYTVYHDMSVYDLRDGKLDRSKAYTYALEGVQAILTKHPSIQVVIDLHRDGVAENVHLVTELDGKPTAQIMFFNGMSQTPTGPIAYLENPYREENLAFSFQMQMEAMTKYPGLTRKIYLKGLRYNLHVRPRALLIEAGAQTNTFEEAKNAMGPLADILDAVLGGHSQ